MTTNEIDAGQNLEELNSNLAKIEDLSQRLVAAMSHKRQVRPSLQGPGQDLYMKAAAAYMAEMMANPAKIIEHQVSYWGKSLKHYVEAQQALASGKLEAPEDHTPTDKRFANELWQTHPFFNFMKQQYMLNAEAVQEAVSDLEGLDSDEKRRIEYFSRQIVDMFSPTNFLGTNPEALTRAVETNGQSLVDGLENLVRDLEAADGEMLVNLADKEAFTPTLKASLSARLTSISPSAASRSRTRFSSPSTSDCPFVSTARDSASGLVPRKFVGLNMSTI